MLEEHGIHTPAGFIKPPPGVLTKPTVNRYLKALGYDLQTLTRIPPAVRFQAEFSNERWQFDLSQSDLKHLEKPPVWVEPGRGLPTLMLYSVADDRSGVCYQEFHCGYGEDTEAAVARVSLMTDERSGTVKMIVSSNAITIRAQRSGEGEAVETIEAEYAGEDCAIGFNAKYLLDFLSLSGEATGEGSEESGKTADNGVRQKICRRAAMSFKDTNTQTLFSYENFAGLECIIMSCR